LKARKDLLNKLAEYCWRDPENRVVYEAMKRLAGCDVTSLRERMPAEATRMGFPDVDWERYFQHDGIQATDVVGLVEELMRAAGKPA
jgi:hypothetical protein